MGKITLRRSLTALAVAATLGFTSNSFGAGGAESDLLGSVQVNGINTSGYTVVAKNPKTGFTRQVSTRADGSYRLSKLPTGSYEIVIMNGNSVVGRDVATVTLGSNAIANFDIAQSSNTEVIEVTGARFANVDVSSTDSGLLITEADFDALPVLRNLTSVALLAPGVVLGDSNFSTQGGSGLASFGGSSVAENACFINGLEVTNTRQGLGCGSVPFEFYKDFQVKTGGYSAEFGRATGGIINAITKSGTNEWEFTAVSNWTPSSLTADSKGQSRGKGGTGDVFRDTTNDEFDNWDITLTASGALIEDTLFIYALVNPRSSDRDFSYYTGSRQQYAPDDEYRKISSDGSDNLFWGAKVDWFITEDHRVSIWGYSDRNDGIDAHFNYDPNTGVIGNLTGTNIRERGGETVSVSYVGNITDDLTVTGLWGNVKAEYTTTPDNIVCPRISDSRDLPASQRATGCGPGTAFGANNDDNTQYRLDIEYLLGDHKIRVGYDYQERDSFRESLPAGGHSYTYTTLAAGGSVQGNDGNLYTNTTGVSQDIVFDRIFTGGGGFGSELEAFYVEDEWQITDNLLLTAGLRWDDFLSVGTSGVTFQEFSADVAPRLGFSWDINGDGESKLYATLGRYYLPPANNTNFRLASGVDDNTTYYTFTGIDAADGVPIGLDPVNGTTADSNINNSTSVFPSKSVYQEPDADPFHKNEFIIGYERSLSDDLALAIRGTYREVGEALDDYCGARSHPLFCTGLNPGKPARFAVDADLDGFVDLDANGAPVFVSATAEEIALPEANNEYLAVNTEVRYRKDDLNLNFSYTWSRSTGNFEGAVKSDIAQADAGITQDFDFPALHDGGQGYQPNDRRHVFKLFGSYSVTEDWTVGFNSTLSSGRPLNTFGAGYITDDPNLFGSYGDTYYQFQGCSVELADGETCGIDDKIYNFTPRGSAGRTSWQFKVDLSSSYNFEVSGIAMRASVDVFNIFDDQSITSQNEHFEGRRAEGTQNPWFDAAYFWQAPRSIRLGFEARF
jgi:outer membrane receptor for ferrienterochelin and colicin